MAPRILSAGIIPIFKSAGQWHFLVMRCFNYWDFPKGELNAGEDPLITAIRELKEETGLDKYNLLFQNAFIETEPYSKNKVARYYLAQVFSREVQLLPNPENGIIEHHEYRWLTFAEAKALLGPRLQKVIDWANQLLENKNES